MKTSSRRRVCVVAAALMLSSLCLAGCGGEDDPIPGPDPELPTRASITVSMDNASWGQSLRSGFAYAFAFDLRIRETAGVAAHLNYLRADFYSQPNGGGSRLERQQMPGRSLNDLPANGTLVDSFVARFNAGATQSVVVTISFRDAFGNVTETQREFNCCGPWATGGLSE